MTLRGDAADLLAECDVIDLHQETFIWTRVMGYDMAREHRRALPGGWLLGQSDMPRLARSGLTGVVQSVATFPLRAAGTCTGVLLENLERLRAVVEGDDGFRVVRDSREYRRARDQGKLGCFVAVQGGNALDRPQDVDRLPAGLVSRVTLVHMTDSWVGRASSPLGGVMRPAGLTAGGRDLVRALAARGIIVDLAHIHERGFAEALDAHAGDVPPVVSHTGVRAVHDSWRNLADWQIRAIADRGGVVGVFAHAWALARPGARVDAGSIVAHMQHVIDVGGEQCAALGTDLDGFIVPPGDMRSVDRLPVLVEHMIARGWSRERMTRVLGKNALRVLERPGLEG